MKLTATQLRRIIAEEVSRLTEGEPFFTVTDRRTLDRVHINVGAGRRAGEVEVDMGIKGTLTLSTTDALKLGEALVKALGGLGAPGTNKDI